MDGWEMSEREVLVGYVMCLMKTIFTHLNLAKHPGGSTSKPQSKKVDAPMHAAAAWGHIYTYTHTYTYAYTYIYIDIYIVEPWLKSIQNSFMFVLVALVL